MRPSSFVLITLTLGLSVACGAGSYPSRSDVFTEDNRSSESEGGAYETFNEDNYSNVSEYGSGSESSGAYYGTGSNSPEEPPERTPAEPSVREHSPY
jgi:hypothetical protein